LVFAILTQLWERERRVGTTAFMSYSSQDRQIGERFQRALEWYRVPRALRDRHTKYGKIAKRIGPVYRDRSDLAANDDLGATIERALTESRYLIVLCSPASARSPWVNREIEFFKELGREDEIIAVLVDGRPVEHHPVRAADGAFPPALTQGGRNPEPFAPDLRAVRTDGSGGDGFDFAKLKVVSRIIDIPLGELTQRQFEAERRERRVNTFIVIAVTALAAGVFMWWQEALRQEVEKLRNESRFLAERAGVLIDAGDPLTAMRTVMRGLPRDDERPVVAEARREMRRALHMNRQLTCVDPGDRVPAFAVHPVRPGIVALSNGDEVALWDLESGIRIRPLAAAPPDVVGLDFDRDGRRLAVATDSGRVLLLDAKTGQALSEVPPGGPGRLATVEIAPGGDRVALVSTIGDRDVTLWSPSTGALQTVAAAGTDVRSAAFGPDGTTLLVATLDGAMILEEERGNSGTFFRKHDLRDTAEAEPDVRRNDFVRAVLDGRGEWAVIGRNERVSVFDVATGQKVASGSLDRIRDLNIALRSIDISPDARSVALAANDKSVRIWDLETGRETLRLGAESHTLCEESLPGDDVTLVRYTPDGRVVSAYGGGSVRFWEVGDLPPRQDLEPVGRTPSLAVTQDGWAVADGLWTKSDEPWELGIWTGPGEPAESRAWPDTVIEAVDLSRDGGRIAVWLSDKKERRPLDVKVLDTELVVLRSIRAELGANSVLALDAPGEHLAMAARGGVEIWSVKDGQLVSRHCVGDAKVEQLSFSPEGGHLLGLLSDAVLSVHRWAVEPQQDPRDCAAGNAGAPPDGTRLCAGMTEVAGVAAGPKGLVACLSQSFARVVQADSQDRPFVEIRPLVGSLRAVAFGPKGKRIAGTSSLPLIGERVVERLVIWDVETGERIVALPYVSEADLKALAFSRDGDYLLTLAAVQGSEDDERRVHLAAWPVYGDVHELLEAARDAIPGCRDAIARADGEDDPCALPDNPAGDAEEP
jgi:WD40 repeat protein